MLQQLFTIDRVRGRAKSHSNSLSLSLSLHLQGGFPAWEEFIARGMKFQKHFE